MLTEYIQTQSVSHDLLI